MQHFNYLYHFDWAIPEIKLTPLEKDMKFYKIVHYLMQIPQNDYFDTQKWRNSQLEYVVHF